MKKVETEILIKSSPEKVWNILTDFEKYPNWNPFIKSISGDPNQGIKVLIQAPESKPMEFEPNVLVFDENKEFRWKGKFLIKGIFDGEHYFLIEPNGDGVKFTHGEKFSGVLVSVMGKMLKKVEDGFEAMNEALKKECEK